MKLPLSILVFLVVIVGGYMAWQLSGEDDINIPNISSQVKEKPLDKYTFDAMGAREFEPSEIELGETLSKEESFTARLFYFRDSGKRVSGQINIPEGEGPFPVIVMYRGYVDREDYRTGIGTERAAEVYARNGFVTVAPDFLGYGSSDETSLDAMEDRFLTYTTALTILKSIEKLNIVFEQEEVDARVDAERIGIWGHSNGGQISISVLEITQEKIPTVMWAPVSKPFPYSVLYYTDEFDDRGKYLRREIAKFEENYDVDDYSIEKYFDRIISPIQIYQGTIDDSVPIEWSDEFVAAMEKLEKDVEYTVYNGADHNLLPNGWNDAVSRSMEFYRNSFERR